MPPGEAGGQPFTERKTDGFACFERDKYRIASVTSPMSRPLFISLDGPKGVGKTTLLEAITQVLRSDNQKVVRLCEKKSDPWRAETMALVNRLARHPSPERELEVCARFAASRAWISQHVLTKQPADSLILIDRWYPSDAAFRRSVPFARILQLNLEHNVRTPDLHVGVVTAPEMSWARAAARSRGLSSTVIHTLDEHIACTRAFEREVADHGWFLCCNEGTLEDATRQVVSAIYQVAGRSQAATLKGSVPGSSIKTGVP